MKSSNPVDVISTLLYGQVTNDPVPLALFVTLATQPSEVFYRALVSFRLSVIRIFPSIIFLFVQRNAAHFARVKDEEHPKNLTSHKLISLHLRHYSHRLTTSFLPEQPYWNEICQSLFFRSSLVSIRQTDIFLSVALTRHFTFLTRNFSVS